MPLIDDTKIVQALLASKHRKWFLILAEQAKVCPQRRAQEAHAIKHHFVLIEDLHVGLFPRNAQQAQGLKALCAIKLMVAGHVQDRLIGKRFSRPIDTLVTFADIAGQDDHVRVRCRWLER